MEKFIPLFFFVVSILHLCSCSVESERIILKSLTLPYCVVINKNVTVETCTWQNESSKAVRYAQQQLTIHPKDSSEVVEDTTPDVETGSNHTYHLQINSTHCLVSANGGFSAGKCSNKARFVLRPTYIKESVNHENKKPRAYYTIETRSKECVGFSRKVPSTLTKGACNNQSNNSLGQLWTFCTTAENCNINISPAIQLSTTTTSTPVPDAVSESTTTTSQTATVASGTIKSTGSGTYSQIAGLLIILHASYFMLGAHV